MRAMKKTGAVLAGLALGAATLAGTAGAIEGEPIRIKAQPGQPIVKQEYGAMAVNDASSEFSGDPETCKSLPWCTNIPLVVELPEGYDEDVNEFVVKLTVSWDDKPVVDGIAQGNDLDVYVFDVSGKEDEDPNDGEAEPVEVSRSASAREPEVLGVFQPDNGAYEIVVYNFLGPNFGFEVTAEYIDARIRDVSEFFEPAEQKGGGAPLRTSPNPEPALSPSDMGTSDFEAGGELADPAPVEEPSGLALGEEFGTLGGSEFDFEREASPDVDQSVVNALTRRAAVSGPPEPVGAAVLLLSFALVPLALAGGVGTLIWRRRPTALSLDLTPPAGA